MAGNGRKHVSAVVCILSLSLILGTASAYMTYWQRMVNTFTIGRNTIIVAEEYAPPPEMKAGDNCYRKKVQVKNTGTVPCYIRVFAGFSDGDIAERSQLSADGVKYYPVLEYTAHLPDGWVYISEEEQLTGGYYYFTEAVEPGHGTAPLFEMVNTHFEKAEDVTDYEIFIYAESVQVQGVDGTGFDGPDEWRQAWIQFFGKEAGD